MGFQRLVGDVHFDQFPQDAKRCKIWARNCRRAKWKPSSTSRLCEEHFEDSQFECNRQDGRKLLKRTAVPTIFVGYKIGPKQPAYSRPPPKIRTLQELENAVKTSPAEPEEDIKPAEKTEVELLRDEIKALKGKLKKCEKEMEMLTEHLDTFLNVDQISYLKRTATNTMPWTEQTIFDALEIRLAAGEKAYSLLRRKGYPLPSNRTLTRYRSELLSEDAPTDQ